MVGFQKHPARPHQRFNLRDATRAGAAHLHTRIQPWIHRQLRCQRGTSELQPELGVGFEASQWVVNAYLLTLASLILFGGSVGDTFGQRRTFILGLSGFAAASVACGLAPTVMALVVFRGVQGAAGAFLIPASLALVGTAFSGEERGRAIGTWAAAGAITTALGPPLGGWLVDVVGWRSVFFLNAPIAAAALVMAIQVRPDRPDATAASTS